MAAGYMKAEDNSGLNGGRALLWGFILDEPRGQIERIGSASSASPKAKV